jgi:hypothetical protein
MKSVTLEKIPIIALKDLVFLKELDHKENSDSTKEDQKVAKSDFIRNILLPIINIA